MEIHSAVLWLLYANRQKDVTKLTGAFLQLEVAKSPKYAGINSCGIRNSLTEFILHMSEIAM
jgi:hypothetical protein